MEKNNKPLTRQLRVLEVVLQHIKEKPDEETFHVPFDEFSTKDPLFKDREGLEKAFQKINAGNEDVVSVSLEFVETGTMTTITDGKRKEGYDTVKVHVEDPDKLRSLYKGREKEDTKEVADEQIKFIELLPDEFGDGFIVYVNGDYENEIRPNTVLKSWVVLKEIADNDIANRPKKEAEKIVEYFNTRPEHRLYSKTKYVPTEILKSSGGDITALVPINFISKRKISKNSPKTPKKS